MKNLKYILILLLLVPFSCIDDKSKFSDTEIDEIVITGIEKSREIEVGSKLEISQVVTTKFGEKSKLSYVWYKYNQEQHVADTLSREKDLSVVIGDVLPGVENTLVFKVIDDQTGVYALNKSTFTTVGKYSGGTLALCKTDGEMDLAMLKKDGTTLYENIYATANNGEKLGTASKRIFQTDLYPRNPLAYKAVIVTCDDETGGVYLDPTIFERKDDMKNKFMFGDELEGKLAITGYAEGQGTDYITMNGKVYVREYGSSEENVSWNPALVFLADPTDYSMANYTAHPTDHPFYASPLFYDNLNGRFAFNQQGGFFSSLAGVDSDFSKFDPNNMGKGVKMILSGSMNSTLDEVWALMKDENKDEYFVITYKFTFVAWTSYTFFSLSKSALSKASNADLYSASIFIPGTKPKIGHMNPWEMSAKGISDIFFFVSNNKVMAFNVKTLSGGVLIDGDTEGYTVTSVDCTEVAAPTETDPKASFVQLTLGVKDKKLSSKSGGIAVYRLNSIGGISAQKMYAKTGFCDEVIATVEKTN